MARTKITKDAPPRLMTSTDVGAVLGIKHTNAVKVMDSPGFPLIRMGPSGTRYVKEARFWEWLHSPDGQKWLSARKEWLISRGREV